MRILMLAGVLLVVGCAPTQEYTWYKRFDPSMEDRQRDIDLARCTTSASTDGAYAATGIDSEVRVSAIRIWLGISSGPSMV